MFLLFFVFPLLLCQRHCRASRQPDNRAEVFGRLLRLDAPVLFFGVFRLIVQ